MYYNVYGSIQKRDLGDIKVLTPEQREIGNKVIKSYGFHDFSGSLEGDTLHCEFATGPAATLGDRIGKDLKKAFNVRRVLKMGYEL